MNYITTRQKQMLWTFVAAIIIFTITFILQKNFEFIGYVVITSILLLVVLVSARRVTYPDYVLWGLLAWAVLHMLGGVALASGKVVYTLILYPIVGEPYQILKYDQVVHAFGFFVATLVMFYVLKKYLVRPFGPVAIGIVVAMAGLGLGALNEIVEFFMTIILPNTNVGGYENTALDLVFNSAGAVLAVFFLRYLKEVDSEKLADTGR